MFKSTKLRQKILGHDGSELFEGVEKATNMKVIPKSQNIFSIHQLLGNSKLDRDYHINRLC